MKAVKLTKNIYWVGAIDNDLRSFHGYTTKRGTTYNAYLILDEKVTLIDTVKKQLSGELIERISSIIPPEKIDIIISNHVEPDHSGALCDIQKLAKNAKIYTVFPSGEKGLKAYYHDIQNLVPVKSGESISTGKYTLQFVATPMVHWPDNMVTYLPEEKILFSNDAFGQHFASNERIDCQSDLCAVYQEAQKYYANIVQPYSLQAKKALDTVNTLDISMICPSHGVIWKDNIKDILSLYKKWTAVEKKRKGIVVYDTMWSATEKMAYAVQEAFLDSGIEAKIYNLQTNHESDIVTELLDAEYLAVGSPTINNNILPTVAAFLSYVQGLSAGGIKYISFGSYGWSGQSADIVDKQLENSRFTRLAPPYKVNYMPDKKYLDNLYEEVKKLI